MKPPAIRSRKKLFGFDSINTVSRWFEHLPNWVVLLILAVIISSASVWYLWPSPVEFPMDDSYIHLVYARNLANEGKLFFNEAGERGVGTSSILWVLLLAGGFKLGISLEITAKVIGIVSLVFVSSSIYFLLRAFWHPLISTLASLLVGLSGNMLWFSLSGMETTFFLALGMLALLAYREKRWCCLGAVLGFLILARPEGLCLALVIGLIDILYQRRIQRGLVISGLICAGLCVPWFGYLLWRSGNILPTSGIIKHLSSSITLEYGLRQQGDLAFLRFVPGLLYVILWVVYLLEFTLGGMTLPGPHIVITNVGGKLAYTLSVWSIPAWVLVITLLVAAGWRFRPRQKGHPYLQSTSRRTMIVLLAWCIMHNICYMVFLPAPGTSSRYGALNHILLWLVLFYGLLAFGKRRRVLMGLAAGLFAIAFANTVYWNGVYDANLDHMLNVRIEAAHFIRDRIAWGDSCAASDIGAIRYHSGRQIVDLGGLITPDAFDWLLQGRVDQYIINQGVEYLALPGRLGASEEGWLDIADILGLPSSSLFRMESIAIFEISYERWLQGYLPTTNYQESVVIYRLLPIAH